MGTTVTRTAAATAGAAGLIASLAGTFLPWLHSGRAERNLYQAAGALRQVGHIHGIADLGLHVAPLLGIGCALAAAAYLLGSHRSAAALAAMLALSCGAGAIGTLRARGNGGIQPAVSGPVLTLAGALLTLAAATVVVVIAGLGSGGRQIRTSPAGGHE